MLRATLNPRAFVAVVAIAGAVALVGCGSSSSTTSRAAGTAAAAATSTPASNASGDRPTVLAAASLTKVFPQIDPNAKYTFGGSGALETDIEQGAPADVFAAASPKQPAALLAKGLVDKPVQFATNTLVLIVPRDNPAHITSVSDITKPSVKLVICDATVPCGDYARNAFKNLGITTAAMKNVVSQTTDVTQTVAEVAPWAGRRRIRLHHRRRRGQRQGGPNQACPPRPSRARRTTSPWSSRRKNPAAAKAFVATGDVAGRPSKAQGSRVRRAVSAAAGDVSIRGGDTSPRRAALGRIGVAVGAVMLIAVVLSFLLLPIVALITYQPIRRSGPRLRDPGRRPTRSWSH